MNWPFFGLVCRGLKERIPLSEDLFTASARGHVNREVQTVIERMAKKGLPRQVSRGVWKQDPREGGFSKGGLCRIQLPRALCPAAHFALKVPQPREAYDLAKTPFYKPPCLGSWRKHIWLAARGTGQGKWLEEVPGRTSLAPLVSPCFVLCLIGVETEGLLDYQGRAGIIPIVRWNLRPVIFGVERRGCRDRCQEGSGKGA